MVAVSGGVDSSTSAALLRQQGYACQGVFMITHNDAHAAQADAIRVCRHLDIPLHIRDLRPEFERLIEYFVGEYRRGRTPNPCVMCNRTIKFGRLWEFAQSQGADFLATGHYAHIATEDGQSRLYQAHDRKKDQSYVLAFVRRPVWPHILLPMAGLSKDQTRALAAQFDIPVHQKKDSQEICFIPDDDYAGLAVKRCPQLACQGHIVDTSGKIMGSHSGIYQFTIGQRRGLGIPAGKPVYVVKLDAASNTVVLGSKEETLSNSLIADSTNWLIDPPTSAFEAIVKIRYNHIGAPARVSPLPNDRIDVEFQNPISAITPGQAAVVYIQRPAGLQAVCGGWILRAGTR